MKTFSYLLVLVCLTSVISCAHCSRTISNFDGKTKSLNPYGDGKLDVQRESYWGNLNCISRMMDNAI